MSKCLKQFKFHFQNLDFLENDEEKNYKWFLKWFLEILCYGSTEIDFLGIAHVKIGLIAL